MSGNPFEDGIPEDILSGVGTADENECETAWHDPADGLRTISALLHHIPTLKNPGLDLLEAVLDLLEFEDVLAAAERMNYRWHLAMDM